MKISCKRFLSPLVILSSLWFSAFGALAHAQTPEIIQYGQNAPGWNQKLGVTATRGSCNLAPAACVQTVRALLSAQGTQRFYLNIFDDPNIVRRALYYSSVSLATPGLYELDIDDFADHFNDWCRRPGIPCDALLGQIIASTKAKNPELKFGVTIYEDDLQTLVQNPRLTPQLRREIDTVHLYPHLRQNGPNIESFVNIVRRNFPNATVIAGAYPYDRIDYVACGDSPCNPQQELNLYKLALETDLSLLPHQVISGIEFYPGYFGMEEKIPTFNDPKGCAPWRRQQCIADTEAMHQVTVQLLNRAGIGGR